MKEKIKGTEFGRMYVYGLTMKDALDGLLMVRIKVIIKIFEIACSKVVIEVNCTLKVFRRNIILLLLLVLNCFKFENKFIPLL
jgi:hypothetical protein